MPGDRAPGARQAQTVLRTVCVRACSPGPVRCAGHPASPADSHGCVQRPATATVAPGAVWWGAVWSEVKEEGRMDSREALESTTGPGDMNATRHPAAPLSRRLSTENRSQRETAKGRECAFDLRRTRRSPGALGAMTARAASRSSRSEVYRSIIPARNRDNAASRLSSQSQMIDISRSWVVRCMPFGLVSGPADRNRTCISRLGGMRTIHCATAGSLGFSHADLRPLAPAPGPDHVQ